MQKALSSFSHFSSPRTPFARLEDFTIALGIVKPEGTEAEDEVTSPSRPTEYLLAPVFH